MRFDPTATIATSLMFPGVAIKEDGTIHVAYYLLAVTILMRLIDIVGIWFFPNLILYWFIRIVPVILSLGVIVALFAPKLMKFRGNPDRPILTGLGFIASTALLILISWLVDALHVLNAFIAVGIIAVIWPRRSPFRSKAFIWIMLSYFLFLAMNNIRSRYLVEAVLAEGESMEETLSGGSIYFVQKTNYGDLERGDIVVINTGAYLALPERISKRIVAIEGDTLEIDDGSLFVNSELIKEEVLGIGCYGVGYQLKINDGYIFVLGDNSIHSVDSRLLGPIPEHMVSGKMLIP